MSHDAKRRNVHNESLTALSTDSPQPLFMSMNRSITPCSTSRRYHSGSTWSYSSCIRASRAVLSFVHYAFVSSKGIL